VQPSMTWIRCFGVSLAQQRLPVSFRTWDMSSRCPYSRCTSSRCEVQGCGASPPRFAGVCFAMHMLVFSQCVMDWRASLPVCPLSVLFLCSSSGSKMQTTSAGCLHVCLFVALSRIVLISWQLGSELRLLVAWLLDVVVSPCALAWPSAGELPLLVAGHVVLRWCCATWLRDTDVGHVCLWCSNLA
jgi:hypothetical protein